MIPVNQLVMGWEGEEGKEGRRGEVACKCRSAPSSISVLPWRMRRLLNMIIVSSSVLNSIRYLSREGRRKGKTREEVLWLRDCFLKFSVRLIKRSHSPWRHSKRTFPRRRVINGLDAFLVVNLNDWPCVSLIVFEVDLLIGHWGGAEKVEVLRVQLSEVIDDLKVSKKGKGWRRWMSTRKPSQNWDFPPSQLLWT